MLISGHHSVGESAASRVFRQVRSVERAVLVAAVRKRVDRWGHSDDDGEEDFE